MKKTSIVRPIDRKKGGSLILNFDADESSADWLGYSWLKKLAGEGNEEAQKEIERMDKSEMTTEIE